MWCEYTVEVNGARVRCLEAGPADGPLALCLHGFPDTPYTWRHLAPALAAAGRRVVAPFLRGYAPTEAPADGPAGPTALGADANALHAALGGDGHAVLVGHDWGAAAAYAAATAAPRRWRRLVASGWPPLPRDVDLASHAQMRRSWYVFLLQLPAAEAVLAADNFALVDRLWADWSPGYDADEDARRAKAALRDPRCLRLAVAHYRALYADSAPDLPPASPPTVPPVPVLYLHGDQDGCIGVELTAGLAAAFPPGSRVAVVRAAGHFPQLEQPDVFNGEVLRAVDEDSGAAPPGRA